ncbi:MAG: flagellar basal body rod protein FlgB [Parvularculaceae bacterium]|nr:flagellar basal body rod protein FlgB [Parvularculaceae bacterium]
MDLMKSPLLAGLAQRLQFLSARTGVIAQNIANADTPDYSARDVAPADFKKLASAGASAQALRTSDPRHIRAAANSSAAVRTVAAPDGEAALNGNNVSLETQMMKLSETRMDYQLASSVYRKGLGLVRLAIGANR